MLIIVQLTNKVPQLHHGDAWGRTVCFSAFIVLNLV